MGSKTRSARLFCYLQLRGVKLRDFLVADFEFTVYTKPTGKPRGFFSEILEYGWVRLDADSKDLSSQDQNFVKPKFFPKQAKEGREFSMITEADLAAGIEYSQMIGFLNKVYDAEQTYFVAWGDADWYVIKEACARYQVGHPLRPESYVDLSREYQGFYELNYRPSLKNALAEQEIKLDGLWHTALDDALNTAKLVAHMLNQGWTVMKNYEELK